MIKKYRKKPVVIEALQLTWETWGEICKFITLPWGEEGVHGVYDKDDNVAKETIEDIYGDNKFLNIPCIKPNLNWKPGPIWTCNI